jgi:serine/threonine-protein kinase PknG
MLAVLTLDFRGYQSTFRHCLPDPAEHPALARFDSFHRFLLKGTAPHPDDRFQSADEMGDQLLGVLQEVVALSTGRPHPAPSAVFAPPPDDEALPPLAIDPADPAASFLTNLAGDSPTAVLAEIGDAVGSGQVADTVEVRLRTIRALVDSGEHVAAGSLLDRSEAEDPWEWRAVWFRGISALATGTLETATAAFDRCWSEVPGELAPKLAAAQAAERRGDLPAAAALYEVTVMVDPSFIAAAKGLARCRAAMQDVAGAMAAYDRIPRTHRAYAAAQLDAVRVLIAAGRFSEAGQRLDRLEIDQSRRAELDVELFDAALAVLTDGALGLPPSITVGGRALDERDLRLGLEDALRRTARLTPDAAERCRIVDRANSVRPLTLL